MNSEHKAWIFVVVLICITFLMAWDRMHDHKLLLDAQARDYDLKQQQLVVRVLEVTDMMDRASGGKGGGDWRPINKRKK